MCTSLFKLHLQKKIEILNHPNPTKFPSKRLELISKWSHVNRDLFQNYKSNDYVLQYVLQYFHTFIGSYTETEQILM